MSLRCLSSALFGIYTCFALRLFFILCVLCAVKNKFTLPYLYLAIGTCRPRLPILIWSTPFMMSQNCETQGCQYAGLLSRDRFFVVSILVSALSRHNRNIVYFVATITQFQLISSRKPKNKRLVKKQP